MVGQNTTIHKDNEEEWTLELEWLKKETVWEDQEQVHKGTNFENLLIRVTNKSWNKCIRFCIRSMSFTKA